jgi:AcrR family transcriptional regulator
MVSEPSEPRDERRSAILDAATAVFLRYGYKKTSMDDLARAAGLSRQGLYLSFATKEALFKAGVLRLVETTRAAGEAALARSDRSVEDRILDLFVAVHGQLIGEPVAEHMTELMETARALVGPVADELEQAQVADLARVLRTSGIAAAWKDLDASAKDLAEQLMATSYGAKHRAKNADEYRERMRVAVQMICRGKPHR